ncbi:hypothetical protein PTTG_00398 [Puccinia triticina 1-1 BBBD Race 1]|uniref:RlpA-like protein double-psi beta-barrel domain-containing protein n=2 Tax=Puccinia triticina TaxID=208348 RepID=A0A180H031_PUCT1|nr:uncharacterized protein PtA15_8A495 [Puccinia triticina]OAV98350.1 hypothetical protein PTTG_00398 [Puccinia triticina 1-1 BBBD Race 1]WAQ87591.1 hypothetical protein PtA15_8A495 [Puccinia triticina]WAR57439.1 hypothetical protein PtB15_8B486 [Puccinia triticina]
MRFDFRTSVTVLVVLIPFSWALEKSPASHHALESRSTDDEGWFDLSVSFRMKREESSSSPLQKRSEFPASTPVILKRSPETGKLVLPRSLSEALTMASQVPEIVKRSLQRRTALARRAMRVIITWYDGHDLLKPACFDESTKWAPTDDSMVAAVTIDWAGKPRCGSFVRIEHLSDPTKHIVVRIADECGGCPPKIAHIDLTVGAFKKLYDKDVGEVGGLKAKVVPCPREIEKDWSKEVIDTYGPKETINIS